MLIALPSGSVLGGVTSWAVRLLNALAPTRRVGLLLHRASSNSAAVATAELPLDPRVQVTDLAPLNLPALEDAAGELGPFLPHYRRALEQLGAAQTPVAFWPSLLGDCYGIAAALSREPGLHLRTIGVAHSDNRYDVQVLAHYEPVLHALIGVSPVLSGQLAARCPARVADTHTMPAGVDVPVVCPPRPGSGDRGLRLMYAGRFEHDPKRVLALVTMSDVLLAAGRAHHLTLLGEGSARDELLAAQRDRASSERRTIEVVPPVAIDRVGQLLREHDVFVLASRYEGLPVAMLEAMAAGCCPVVTARDSGASTILHDGRDGLLVDAPVGADQSDTRATGEALAAAVLAHSDHALRAMGRAAHALARAEFDIASIARRTGDLLDRVASQPPRIWPEHRPAAFTARPGQVGSGTVPADAATRMERLLDSLAGHRLAIHGTGQHTRELSHVLRSRLDQIVAFSDDDPTRRGRTLLDRLVVAPESLGATGASDVVISSCLHQESIWSRREVFERQGLRVHRLYD